MKKLKNYWNNLVGKVLEKLSRLFSRLHKIWEHKRREEKFNEGTKRMLEIVDYMEQRSKNKFYVENENSRKTVNEANNELSHRFNEMRNKIIVLESSTRDNVDDPVVNRLLEKIKELPLENTDPVKDLIDANPHMMTDDKFVKLLEDLKAQNVVTEKKAITINQ
jgi:Zn-dependent M32 family carboxypeptidase